MDETSHPVSEKSRNNIIQKLNGTAGRLSAASLVSNPGRSLRAEIKRARAVVSWMSRQPSSESRAARLRQLDDNTYSLCVTTFTANQLQSFHEHEFAELLRTTLRVIKEQGLSSLVSTLIAPRVRSMLTEKQYGFKLKEATCVSLSQPVPNDDRATKSAHRQPPVNQDQRSPIGVEPVRLIDRRTPPSVDSFHLASGSIKFDDQSISWWARGLFDYEGELANEAMDLTACAEAFHEDLETSWFSRDLLQGYDFSQGWCDTQSSQLS